MFGAKTRCAGCGEQYAVKRGACPICLVEVGQRALRPLVMGGPASNVRVYMGINQFARAKAFQQEALRLAAVGWVPGQQSQDAHTLTVTYSRAA